MPKKILSLKSSRHHYKADACIVWCFDYRFRKLFSAFLKKRGYKHVDRIIVAGGAKSLTSQIEHKAYILSQIQASVKLHNAPRVILMTHSDCGAYGGLKAFYNESTERKRHREDLKQAASFVKQYFPRAVKVETVFADFEGLHSL